MGVSGIYGSLCVAIRRLRARIYDFHATGTYLKFRACRCITRIRLGVLTRKGLAGQGLALLLTNGHLLDVLMHSERPPP